MVLCLEDSIDDAEVAEAEENLVRQFADLDARAGPGAAAAVHPGPRRPSRSPTWCGGSAPAVRLLSGFVLPKFTEERGVPFLEALAGAEAASGRRLFAMPVLESPELLHLRDAGSETLEGIARTVDKYRDRVLALRLGVTDFCSAYGLRRAPDMTAYDVQIVASVIADVVNVLGPGRRHRLHRHRAGVGVLPRPGAHVQAAAAPQPLPGGPGRGAAPALIEHDMDGLLREIELDRANGLLGKTCIHPSHVAARARAVGGQPRGVQRRRRTSCGPERGGGGVLRSAYTNKMNEVKPHRAWAERTLLRAEVFGVAREDVGFVELLAAGIPG